MTFKAKLSTTPKGQADARIRTSSFEVSTPITIRFGGIFVTKVQKKAVPDLPSSFTAGAQLPAVEVQYITETGEAIEQSHDKLFDSGAPTKCILEPPSGSPIDLDHTGNGTFVLSERLTDVGAYTVPHQRPTTPPHSTTPSLTPPHPPCPISPYLAQCHPILLAALLRVH